MSVNQPNVVIFMVDQLRYDACGFAGNPMAPTPNIDWLAQHGVACTNAFASSPVCTPARASMWTGLFAHAHGMAFNVQPFSLYFRGSIDPAIPTLGQHFQHAGYETAYFGKWHLGAPGAEANEVQRCGFQHVDLDRPAHVRRRPEHLKDADYIPYIGERYLLSAEHTGPDEAIYEHYLASQSVDWLETRPSRGERPFLLVYSSPAPHPPYVAPSRLCDLYDPNDIPEWPNFRDDFHDKPEALQRRAEATYGAHITWDRWQKAIARYYASISFIDEQLGRILDALRRLSLFEDTLVLFLSDHGDMIGAHRIFDKGASLHEEVVHIPLVMGWSGHLDGGKVYEGFVSLVDILPSLASVIGVDPGNVHGANILPWINGTGNDPHRDDMYMEYYGMGSALYTMLGIRTRRHKYVYHPSGMDELYDLSADPYEMSNLAGREEGSALLLEMRSRLLRWADATDNPLRHRAIELRSSAP